MKTEYERVSQIIEIFEQYWVPYEHVSLRAENGIIVGKLIDKKSGDVYLERYDGALDTYNVYKFDKHSVPEQWSVEEDSNIKVSTTT